MTDKAAIHVTAEDQLEFIKQRKRRNLAILLALFGWVVLIYIVAIIRMSGT